MYVPPAFRVDDATAWAFVEARAFGTLVAVDAGRPVAAHLPLLVKTAGGGRKHIECHVARANPIHEVIARAPDVLVTVMGPDAYVSPDWYVSADQVSTWNYVSVHLSGRARCRPSKTALGHVDDLSAVFENRLLPKKPWTSAKMTLARRTAMLAAVVGIEIEITGLEAQWKLGQHKSAADQAGVLAAWDQGDSNARALAAIARARKAK
jgi:transcriptional regulator